MIAELLTICPLPHDSWDSSTCDVFIRSCDKVVVPCHLPVLRARCPTLLCTAGKTCDCDAEAAVVFAVLRWVYCQDVEKQLRDTAGEDMRRQIACLGERWGLRDVNCLRDRLFGGWRTTRKAGTLEQDILSAYDSGKLGGRITFACDTDDSSSQDQHLIEQQTVSVPAGFDTILRKHSSYFNALLSGKWSDLDDISSGDLSVRVRCPHSLMRRLVRCLHGDQFVRSVANISEALDTAGFFCVPCLVTQANDWIATNLSVETGPMLWRFVEDETFPVSSEVVRCDSLTMADEACFDFHVENFTTLANADDSGKVPLHNLTVSLMHRLLASGLVSMPTNELCDTVQRFAENKCKEQDEMAQLISQLQPPAVLFNRQNRRLLGAVENVTARTFVGGA